MIEELSMDRDNLQERGQDDDEEVEDFDETEEGIAPAGGHQVISDAASTAIAVESVKVAIDWVEFEGALENNSPELHSYLNKITGDVIRVFDGGDNSEPKHQQIEESDDFIYIEPISSREQYRWMEEFIEVVEEPTLKDKLNIAIDGKGAFRRFKDVLMAYPVERERWFARRSSKLHTHMAEWLRVKNVISTNTPPWESQESIVHRTEDRRTRGEADSKNWRDSSGDLRTTARELVELIPSRELPTAVAFLEFLKGRRGLRRQGNLS